MDTEAAEADMEVVAAAADTEVVDLEEADMEAVVAVDSRLEAEVVAMEVEVVERVS